MPWGISVNRGATVPRYTTFAMSFLHTAAARACLTFTSLSSGMLRLRTMYLMKEPGTSTTLYFPVALSASTSGGLSVLHAMSTSPLSRASLRVVASL